MKLNLPLMRLAIKLLILLILFVVLFLVSLTLYSTRYWKDIYNYVHANITIKRIPTLSELNYVVIEVGPTEEYTTTDGYDEASTVHFEFDELTLDEIDYVKKRNVDYKELPTNEVLVNYFFGVGHANIANGNNDLIHDSELTTRYHDVEILAGDFGVKGRSMEDSNIEGDLSTSVFPWIVAIFVKDDQSDQFNYYCDGALLSSRAVITAASCVQANKSTTRPEDLLVFFGKTSLKVTNENEKLAKVKEIRVHRDFTAPYKGSDLAILIIEGPVALTGTIRVAHLDTGEMEADYVATTGWSVTGELSPILLKTQDGSKCDSASEDTVCAAYGNDVPVCPSYGGLYVTKQVSWVFQGLRTGDPEARGLCINRHVAFTTLHSHREWIRDNMK